MPVAMSVIWDIVKNSNKSKKLANLLLEFDEVLGVNIQKEAEEKTLEIPEEIKELIEKRKQARANKDWALSDQIRDELKEKWDDSAATYRRTYGTYISHEESSENPIPGYPDNEYSARRF
jgi:cysteinyl-tRNA synthetase